MERHILKASTKALPAMRRSESRRSGDLEKEEKRKGKERRKERKKERKRKEGGVF